MRPSAPIDQLPITRGLTLRGAARCIQTRGRGSIQVYGREPVRRRSSQLHGTPGASARA